MHTNKIPKILKGLMDNQSINQPQLSKLTGVGQSTIQRILSGAIKSPKNSQLLPLCEYFGVTIDQMIGNEPSAALENVKPQSAIQKEFINDVMSLSDESLESLFGVVSAMKIAEQQKLKR